MSRRNCVLVVCAIAVALHGADALGKTTGDPREKAAIKEIIIHATGGPTCSSGTVVFTPAGTLESNKEMLESDPIVGIHFLVGGDGTLADSIPVLQIANHAKGHNKQSVGIELVNRGDGKDPFDDKQISALVKLCRTLMTDYGIEVKSVLRHSDVDLEEAKCGSTSYRRKQDPGSAFPWTEFLQELKK